MRGATNPKLEKLGLCLSFWYGVVVVKSVLTVLVLHTRYTKSRNDTRGRRALTSTSRELLRSEFRRIGSTNNHDDDDILLFQDDDSSQFPTEQTPVSSEHQQKNIEDLCSMIHRL
jgi:hypothetical protein